MLPEGRERGVHKCLITHALKEGGSQKTVVNLTVSAGHFILDFGAVSPCEIGLRLRQNIVLSFSNSVQGVLHFKQFLSFMC